MSQDFDVYQGNPGFRDELGYTVDAETEIEKLAKHVRESIPKSFTEAHTEQLLDRDDLLMRSAKIANEEIVVHPEQFDSFIQLHVWKKIRQVAANRINSCLQEVLNESCDERRTQFLRGRIAEAVWLLDSPRQVVLGTVVGRYSQSGSEGDINQSKGEQNGNE